MALTEMPMMEECKREKFVIMPDSPDCFLYSDRYMYGKHLCRCGTYQYNYTSVETGILVLFQF